jgi:hypothetical protein
MATCFILVGKDILKMLWYVDKLNLDKLNLSLLDATNGSNGMTQMTRHFRYSGSNL